MDARNPTFRRWVVSAGNGYAQTRIIEAENERAAAEAFTVSVGDLHNGIDLQVQPFEPTHAFHREYEVKGDTEWAWAPNARAPERPVTIEREVSV